MTPLSCSELRRLFRNTPAAIVLVDGRDVIRTIDEQAAELFGYEPEDL